MLSTGIRTTLSVVSAAVISQLRLKLRSFAKTARLANRVRPLSRPALAIFSLLLMAGRLGAEFPTRAKALEIAKAFASHPWTASEKNVLHGLDADRIEVQTPNRAVSTGTDNASLWKPGEVNIGVPYKWGGFIPSTLTIAALRRGAPRATSIRWRNGGEAGQQ